jgi:hypothetical protein
VTCCDLQHLGKAACSRPKGRLTGHTAGCSAETRCKQSCYPIYQTASQTLKAAAHACQAVPKPDNNMAAAGGCYITNLNQGFTTFSPHDDRISAAAAAEATARSFHSPNPINHPQANRRRKLQRELGRTKQHLRAATKLPWAVHQSHSVGTNIVASSLAKSPLRVSSTFLSDRQCMSTRNTLCHGSWQEPASRQSIGSWQRCQATMRHGVSV